MAYSVVGQSAQRVDAVAKVTGKAKYTDDFFERDMLVAKILRSPYAHAWVRQIDTVQAKALPGVEAVLTYHDVPHIKFATAGHPFNLDPKHRDRADRLILTDKARFVGDAVAAVVAADELIAQEALSLIKVEYEELEALLTPDAALREGAPLIHADCPHNILSDQGFHQGDLEQAFGRADVIVEGEYQTSMVQHCHLENHISYAYVDTQGRIVIVTSTQIPHIIRRIVGEALGIPWGRVRVIKPYVGGGFGAKQDACLEPLTAAMTLAVGGRPVKLNFTREECMMDTRRRHDFTFRLKSGLTKDGRLLGIRIEAISNTGAYASHGHSIAGAAGSKYRYLYDVPALSYEPRTVYTNLPVAGAMRGYGSPQLVYALECHMEDIARKIQLDPIDLRRKNLIKIGHIDELSDNKVLSCGIRECLEKGKALIRWEEKQKAFERQTGDKRRGLGVACFSYASGTHPVGLEIAGARIVLNQDGSVQLQTGAAEIGQGSDTVLAQIAAEVLGLPLGKVHVRSEQDTDTAPFDTGAYASRQTYISGMAVKKAAEAVKAKILDFVWGMTDIPAHALDLKNEQVVYKHSGETVLPLAEAALNTYYDTVFAQPITADVSNNARVNAVPYGATFAEVEVDLKTGKIEILEIYNVHDSGTIINPRLAEGQVHGGVSMGIGYALSEQLLFDEKTGRPLNNNLLDYKLPTIMDTPDIGVAFVETAEPTGSFGAKSLGEPPTLSPAPAIRNAVLAATGAAFNRLPMNPQRVFEKLKQAGVI
ncbi:Aldehyde oxidase and xanthine dehydrogenase, a/b hammerhead domain protein [Acididesulfobacillus acetoxydans]|uniref:Aldehyde oxidase and xanthine dehydrogenase, a/b hammerhead domain protein n=2 Tax=Acididesulfobacillus acetoxydans TaxID=1561005 RepID=A0A8S0WPL8_9FIRM|nr:Aldehyde oxidase and xanthine dehydrogenase, a/b hammerhead domain protein [Acididesulfobacillus acetoxydans]CEJ08143.1 Xanthine dehydrogenase molybdenum-binding subunit [Acididesulfobacillus acetoxydans]